MPIVAIILGILVLGEHITGVILDGITLILFGVALTRQGQPQATGKEDKVHVPMEPDDKV